MTLSSSARSPSARRISCWWSESVFTRSLYLFTCGGSATPSRPALQYRGRHVQRVIQECPQPADGHHLQRKPDLHVIPRL